MRKVFFRPFLLMAGAIFDVRGAIFHAIQERLADRRAAMPRSVEEAMRRDWLAIGGDMRRAFDKARSVHRVSLS
ncbi:MAG: hypothetical protein IJU37_11820 [Desulfovibrio sp.]|nr:hypothetical protein [Desulfovibrio sp.]